MPGRVDDPVITGCGVVSSLGVGVRPTWRRLLAGDSAIGPVRRFDAADLVPHMAGEVAGFTAASDRAGALLDAAVDEAVADAALAINGVPAPRLGVAVGTTVGGMERFEDWVAGQGVASREIATIPYFAPAARLAGALGARGPLVTPQLACASGTWAVAMAALWIRQGRADVVLAGGVDFICRFILSGFNALRATAEVARPFDRDRRGLVLGEAAAVVVVEREASARARGGRIRGRLLGVGAAGDAVHMTAPDREGRGAARAMAAALADARVAPRDVGFVSAHGTGTPYNDAMEAAALRRVFGESTPPVDSIKGAIGHTLGAAGAVETVVCVEAIAAGAIPPTCGLDNPDPACAGIDLVHGAPRRRRIDVALSTSSGFGGANAALVVGAP